MNAARLPTIPVDAAAAETLRSKRVLLAGLGNIGSFVALLLAPLVSSIRLIDRDRVEVHNTINQLYEPGQEGKAKAVVTAQRIKRLVPHLQVDCHVADLEDLPWEDIAGVDVVLAGLDSLRARQILAEKVYPLRLPYIDGAVGDAFLFRTQVLLPGEACLECSWGPGQYRQLTTEYPCRIDAPTTLARTTASGAAGAAAAASMVAQLVKLSQDNPPQQSYEISGDLLHGRTIAARRHRNPRCRFLHEPAPRLIHLATSFGRATATDVVNLLRAELGAESALVELRRGLLTDALFPGERFISQAQFRLLGERPLSQLGLTPRDRLVVRAEGQAQATHICFSENLRSFS